jgi:type IV secretion system protein VirB10
VNLPFSRSGPGRDESGSAFDARPLVAGSRRDQSLWWFAGGVVVAAILLFSALEARRQGAAQAERQAPTDVAAPEVIPELVVPALPAEPAPGLAGWQLPGEPSGRIRQAGGPQPIGRFEPPRYQPQPAYNGGGYVGSPPPPPSPAYSQPPIEAPPATAAGAAASGTQRIQAGRLESPASTVIQGTLINAVLETAVDSTAAGQTRAVVTRDVFGFDGTKLLIPRGTRLYGIYEANVAQGQKRAEIRWTRLLRPDGVSVALDSPAADPLGRAGVPANVNNHFLQRFGNALLGTTAGIGSALVTRNISSPVVVAVPGTTQAFPQVAQSTSTQITPTLTVRQGTRITVFVQHDLDFTSIED